jgi:uncharacterized protein (DUF885 family)
MRFTSRKFALKFLAAIALLATFGPAVHAETLQDFAKDFWTWRAQEQPFSTDDIPRLDRPANLVIDWSPKAVTRYRAQLLRFETRFAKLADPAAPITQQVDYRLMGSALARVHWELEIDARWQRDPSFYVDQTLGALYLPLLPPPPFSSARQGELVARLSSFPATLDAARKNLTDLRKPFADLAIEQLADIAPRLRTVISEVEPQLDAEHARTLEASLAASTNSLEDFRAWLQQQHIAKTETAIGRDNYLYFLRQVALMPYTPEQMLLMAQQELHRTLAVAAYDTARDDKTQPLPVFKSTEEQMQREQSDELAIRAYLQSHHILTVPYWVKHYRNLPLPAYVAPLEDLSPTDDLTSPLRLDQDGTSYIAPIHPGTQGFFATSLDPRPIILHEGVPGHYFQKVLSFANPDLIRTHFYDSGPNEGIGFYSEEMMLQAGLFDRDPGTRRLIYNFMKLRALRVEVDVKLALGEFTMAQAMEYMTKTVPMSSHTAHDEVALFATAPGQAMTYQIGKLQIIGLLADVKQRQGDSFSLQRFHDFVWLNGNVPLSLQRWELLHDPVDVPALKLR